jgi:hypothetical protein
MGFTGLLCCRPLGIIIRLGLGPRGGGVVGSTAEGQSHAYTHAHTRALYVSLAQAVQKKNTQVLFNQRKMQANGTCTQTLPVPPHMLCPLCCERLEPQGRSRGISAPAARTKSCTAARPTPTCCRSRSRSRRRCCFARPRRLAAEYILANMPHAILQYCNQYIQYTGTPIWIYWYCITMVLQFIAIAIYYSSTLVWHTVEYYEWLPGSTRIPEL